MTNVILWVAGFALLAIGIWRVRAPYARMQELDRLAENAKRYDSWRGGSSRTAADGERTGADEMRDMMRRQVSMWVALGAVGIVLVILGFAIH